MHNPTTLETPAPVFKSPRQIPTLGMVRPPSFARALRLRGLIAEAATAEWSPVLSVFEAHLRRQAMEQAFAELRGDAA